MALYRDEAIVLRTQKLGEADRIITLLTRSHGRVRAVAKGVRRTSSRFGARLEPFSHVDLQLAEGRSLDVVTQAETLAPYARADGRRLRALHRRHGDAGDRRAARRRGQGARPAAVPAARRRPAGDLRRPAARRPRSSTPSCSARWRSPATRRPSRRAPAAGSKGRTGRSTPRPAACSARPAGCPARRRPATETVAVLGALLSGDWDGRRRRASRHLREASRLVAAYLAWHLERGLKSLAYLQR